MSTSPGLKSQVPKTEPKESTTNQPTNWKTDTSHHHPFYATNPTHKVQNLETSAPDAKTPKPQKPNPKPPKSESPNLGTRLTASSTPASPLLPQVTVGGDVHSLVVFAACNPRVCVVTEPFVFRGALFVPYRHRAGLVEKIVAENTGVCAVFCHVDIVRMGGGGRGEVMMTMSSLSPARWVRR